MKCHLISDIHLEFGDLTLPGGDVLIMAGDVCEVKNIKMAEYDIANFKSAFDYRRPDRYARFFIEEMPKYRQVFYVVGNHEHYGYKFNDTVSTLKSLMPANVTVLEKEYVEFEGVVFLGATLWTDLNGNDPLTAMTLQHNMNDYRVIHKLQTPAPGYKAVNYYKLLPKDTHYDHKTVLKFIEQTMAQIGDKPCVMIGHHAPTLQSVHPRFNTTNDYHMNGGYCSKLDQFILQYPQIKFWVHGHTHDAHDYMVGNTRVLCNPRGYVGYESIAGFFDPTRGFEI